VLATWHQLRSLSLIGNPIAQLPGYRAIVAQLLPQLEVLDGEHLAASPVPAPAKHRPSLPVANASEGACRLSSTDSERELQELRQRAQLAEAALVVQQAAAQEELASARELAAHLQVPPWRVACAQRGRSL
jgi:hypothetical protein